MPEITSSAGSILRAERVRLGRDLEGVAAETRIPRGFLDALERDEFSALPGGAYKRSFLRQYARALGLDETEVLSVFRGQYAESPVALPRPAVRLPSRHLSALVFLALGGLAVLGLYRISGPSHRWAHNGVEAPREAGLESELVSTARTGGEISPVPGVHVILAVTEPVWISVTCDGRPTYTGTLVVAEQRMFDAAAAVTVVAGNAGGLTITLNGHPVGPIGGHGEVQRLELTPTGPRRLPRQINVPTPPSSTPET